MATRTRRAAHAESEPVPGGDEDFDESDEEAAAAADGAAAAAGAANGQEEDPLQANDPWASGGGQAAGGDRPGAQSPGHAAGASEGDAPPPEFVKWFYNLWQQQRQQEASSSSAGPSHGQGQPTEGAARRPSGDREQDTGGNPGSRDKPTQAKASKKSKAAAPRPPKNPPPPPPGPGGSGGGGDDGDDDEDEEHRRRRTKKKDVNPPPWRDGDEEEDEEYSSTAGTSEIKSYLRRRAAAGGDRPRSSLGTVKIDEFYGDRARYVKWKKAIEAQAELYRLEDAELAMLVYLSTKKDARDCLEQRAIGEYTKGGGLQLMWGLLNEAFGETEEELFERAEAEFMNYRRLPGQSVASYIGQMKRLKAQYHRVDPDSYMSDRAWAQRLLNKCSLGRRERLDVFFSAGGRYIPSDIERALRYRCGKVHEDERRLPGRPPPPQPFRAYRGAQ